MRSEPGTRIGHRRWAGRLGAVLAGLGLAASATAAMPATDVTGQAVLERVVILARHGVRAPLDGEAAAAALADRPWPHWSTPASLMTPHGQAAVRLSGSYLQQWLQQQRLLPAHGCPSPQAVQVWANTDQRTIDSGQWLAEALAPGCGLQAGHLAVGSDDPLFRPVEAGAVQFDATEAVAAITAENGGPARLVARHAPQLQAMQTLLGCGDRCDFAAMPSTLAASANGRGLRLGGPIDLTSGTGEVFLLQYAEGLPAAQVAWGRATPERLQAVSRLHALLFDIYARPRYMASRSGAALARTAADRLGRERGPAISLFVGSDNHIAALTSLLGAHFQLPGYGADDPPPGGMLLLERWRDAATGERFVQVEYLAQSLQQLRDLQPLDLAHPPLRQRLQPMACATATPRCPLPRFVDALARSALPLTIGRPLPVDASLGGLP